MKFKYLVPTIMLLILLTLAVVSAVTGVLQTDRFWSNSAHTNPVTGVQEIIYTCSNSECSSKGGLVLNKNTGSSNELTFEYPYNPSSTKNNPDYYSHFSFKECYLPKEYVEWVWGYGVHVDYDYHMRKVQSCHSPIDSFSVTNRNYVNEPVVVEMIADLNAEAQSAFTDLELNWFPEGYEDSYSVETRATLEILNNQQEVIYTDYVDMNILMDTSENVHFEWTPSVEGVYIARITTDVTDCQCSSSFEEYVEKEFTVFPERPANECYTLINNLEAEPQFAQQGDLITFIFDKISNYVNTNHDETPVKTRVDYKISKDSIIVFSDNLLLDENPNSNDPVIISFEWTPEMGGMFGVSVTGIAESVLCVGKTNPEDISTMSYFVEGIEEPECEIDSDCGSPEYSNDFCEGGDVHREVTTPICAEGECLTEVTDELVEWCEYGCELGVCLPEPIEPECETNSECGENSFIGESYCKCKNVWKEFIEYNCNYPGTLDSYCSNEIIEKLFQTCEFGCEEGACLPEPQECEIDSDCGEPYYGDEYCQGNDVVKDLITPVCAQGFCSTEITTETVEECDYDCEDGECVEEEDDKKSESTGMKKLFFECEPLWQCGHWSDCYESMMFRECKDINHCNQEFYYNKPIESMGCEIQKIEPVLEEPVNWFWILIGVLILLIILIILLILKNRNL